MGNTIMALRIIKKYFTKRGKIRYALCGYSAYAICLGSFLCG